MPRRRPAPLTANELREIEARWGKQRLVRVLLWEISRLRELVRLLYRELCRLTRYEHDSHMSLDSPLEEALENEPVVLEEDHKHSGALEPGHPRTRWPHMSEEAEQRLRDSGSSQPSDRDLKRKSREAR